MILLPSEAELREDFRVWRAAKGLSAYAVSKLLLAECGFKISSVAVWQFETGMRGLRYSTGRALLKLMSIPSLNG